MEATWTALSSAVGESPSSYDQFWLDIDATLWELASGLERAPGSMKECFGLYGPEDKRPTCTEEFLGQHVRQEEERLAQEAAAVAPTAYVSNIPVATHQDSIAKAPARTPGEKKPKVKKRKEGAVPAGAGQLGEVVQDEVPDDRKLPEVLADGWKLSKRKCDVRFIHSS